MKIAFFSESPADQAALAVYAEAILGQQPVPVQGLDLQAHGVGGVFSALDGVIRGLHYNSDAEALVVVVDCDDTELHNVSHDPSGGVLFPCRYCQLRAIIDKTRKQLKPVRQPLKVAVGLAVPAIEAWYLVGKDHQVGEAAWITGCNANQRPFTREQLKKMVYGTDRPSIELETACAIREARRAKLTDIENAFPVGFGLMANDIRRW